MKVTKEILRQIIKEEMEEAMTTHSRAKLQAISDVFLDNSGYISVDVKHGDNTYSLTGKMDPSSLFDLKEVSALYPGKLGKP